MMKWIFAVGCIVLAVNIIAFYRYYRKSQVVKNHLIDAVMKQSAVIESISGKSSITLADIMYRESLVTGRILCFSGPWSMRDGERFFGHVVNFDERNVVIGRYWGRSNDKPCLELIPRGNITSVAYAEGEDIDKLNRFYSVMNIFLKSPTALEPGS